MIATNRLKILRVSKEFVLNLLLTEPTEILQLPIYADLKDCTVHDVFWDEQRHCFAYVISNPEWPEKKMGELLEEVQLSLDGQMVVYRKVKDEL